MNEFENRGIEKFFKSKLRTAEKGEEWSSPPDFIFEKAIDQVNQKQKDRKRFLFIWFFVTGIIIVLSAVIYTQFKQLDDVKRSLYTLEDKIVANNDKPLANQATTYAETQIQEANLSEAEVRKTEIEADSENVATTQIKSVLQNQFTPRISPSTINAKPSTINTENQIQLSTSQESYTDLPNPRHDVSGFVNHTSGSGIYTPINQQPINLQNAQTPSNQAIPAKQPQSKNTISIAMLERLQFSRLTIDSKMPSIHPAFAISNTKNTTFQKSFSLGILAGPNLSKFEMTNVMDMPDMDLTKYDDYYWGKQAQVTLSYSLLPRFNLGVQAAYFQINNQSFFTQDMNADENDIEMVNGKRQVNMPMEIITPIGSHKMSSAIILENNLISNNLIRSESDIVQSINSYSLGLTGTYDFIQKTKFNAFVGLGINHHFRNKLNSDFNTKLMMADKLMKEFSTTPETMSYEKRSFNAVNAQLGIHYTASPRIKISFQQSYGKSLNSLREKNQPTDPETFLHFMNSGIGLTYSFTKKH